MEKASDLGCKKGDGTIENAFNWFGCDTTFEMEFEEFCRNDSRKEVDNDMDGPSFMQDKDEEVITKKCKLEETLQDRSRKFDNEFDEWVKANGWLARE
ncbi:hypothetical protein Tco_1503145 [Tanacetum coccineum]